MKYLKQIETVSCLSPLHTRSVWNCPTCEAHLNIVCIDTDLTKNCMLGKQIWKRSQDYILQLFPPWEVCTSWRCWNLWPYFTWRNNCQHVSPCHTPYQRGLWRRRWYLPTWEVAWGILGDFEGNGPLSTSSKKFSSHYNLRTRNIPPPLPFLFYFGRLINNWYTLSVRTRYADLHWQKYLYYGDGKIHSSDFPPLQNFMGFTCARVADARRLVLETVGIDPTSREAEG